MTILKAKNKIEKAKLTSNVLTIKTVTSKVAKVKTKSSKNFIQTMLLTLIFLIFGSVTSYKVLSQEYEPSQDLVDSPNSMIDNNDNYGQGAIGLSQESESLDNSIEAKPLESFKPSEMSDIKADVVSSPNSPLVNLNPNDSSIAIKPNKASRPFFPITKPLYPYTPFRPIVNPIKPIKVLKPFLPSVPSQPNTDDSADKSIIQKAMAGAYGGMLIVDQDGNKIADIGSKTMLEPASTSKLITALAYLTYFPSYTKLSNFNNKTSLNVLKYMLKVSDNELADRLANQVGLDNVQRIAREASGNPKVTVANGSGCPRGLVGGGCDQQGYRPATKVTAQDMVNIVQALDTLLIAQGSSFEELLGSVKTPGTSANKRFGEDFANFKNVRLYAKTGTINSSLSFAGIMYDQYGKRMTFAFMNLGPHYAVGDLQAKVLVQAFLGAKRYSKIFSE